MLQFLRFPILYTDPAQEAERIQKIIEATIGLTVSAILAIILFVIYWRYAHYKRKGEYRYKNKFSEYNHVDVLVHLGMNVLRTHPECFQDKCLYIKAYIVYLYPKNESFFESLTMSYVDVYSSKSLVNWLNKSMNEESIQDCIRFLIHMAAVDGIIADDERIELIQIIDAFKVDSSKWITIMETINEEFVQRQRNWNKRHQENEVSYRDTLISKALTYFSISREALTEEGLRKKYRKMAKDIHPDKFPNASPEDRKELEIKFQELQVYYDELLKVLG